MGVDFGPVLISSSILHSFLCSKLMRKASFGYHSIHLLTGNVTKCIFDYTTRTTDISDRSCGSCSHYPKKALIRRPRRRPRRKPRRRQRGGLECGTTIEFRTIGSHNWLRCIRSQMNWRAI
ncbi:hypothetical protein BIW11_11719 [Tropilaelaps mercedesae]|uniref:Uncharacterized protein n=1 Tax=Tropilaelaps mercedesae TaxID=418985 RepID=A0A1V9X9R9_9ACAR|nr:hypothetical protein BIW11_11719 [Tropilaelaps mercedesae]